MDFDYTIIKDGCVYRISRNRTHISIVENQVLAVPKPQSKEKSKKNGKYHAQNYAKRMKKRSDAVRSICYNSFAPGETVFLTFTFAPERFPAEDLTKTDVTHHYFKLFIKRMNDHYSDFKYLATFGQQQTGNWHYHMLCNLPEIKTQDIRKHWGYGRVTKDDVQNQEHFRNVVNYLVSNMQGASAALEGRKGYLCSLNVQRDIELKSWRSEDLEAMITLSEKITAEPHVKLFAESEVSAGLKREHLDTDTGEILDDFLPNEQMTEEMAEAGFSECVTKYERYSSAVRFPELFKPLETAKLRPKKFKHKKKHNA